MVVLLVSHGAATLTARSSDATQRALRSAGASLRAVAGAGSCLLVVSAHDCRADGFGVRTGEWVTAENDHPAADSLPPWRCRGDAAVAAQARALLEAAGLPVSTVASSHTGLDHGAWLPLRALDPTGAHFAVVAVSLWSGGGSGSHLALGQALVPLLRCGPAGEAPVVACLVASGGLTHNQAEFRRGYLAGEEASGPPDARSSAFADWAVTALSLPEAARVEALLRGAEAHPHFAWCHPTAEHWWPTLVAAGAAAGDGASVLHSGYQHSLSTALVRFG